MAWSPAAASLPADSHAASLVPWSPAATAAATCLAADRAADSLVAWSYAAAARLPADSHAAATYGVVPSSCASSRPTGPAAQHGVVSDSDSTVHPLPAVRAADPIASVSSPRAHRYIVYLQLLPLLSLLVPSFSPSLLDHPLSLKGPLSSL